LLVREALIDGQSVQIGGVGGVMTMPTQQGSGIGRMTMNAVAELMHRFDQMRFGVLFCEPKNVGFYRKLGWRLFDGIVEVRQGCDTIIYDIMTPMVLSVNGVAPRHGRLNVGGLPW
jgi:predicted acetyltransferase